MTEMLFLLFSILVGGMFWKLRQQSEYAKKLIIQHCEKLDLQLLSVARSKFNYRLGNDFLQASFIFEFSSDNDSCYQGHLFLNGLLRARFELPVYRVVDDTDTWH